MRYAAWTAAGITVFYAGMEVGWKMHIYAQRNARKEMARQVDETVKKVMDGTLSLEELLAKAKEAGRR